MAMTASALKGSLPTGWRSVRLTGTTGARAVIQLRGRPRGAAGQQRARGGLTEIVDHQPVAAVQQAARHRHAHVAKPDEADSLAGLTWVRAAPITAPYLRPLPLTTGKSTKLAFDPPSNILTVAFL